VSHVGGSSRQLVPEPPSKLDIDVTSILLGVWVFCSLLTYLGVRLEPKVKGMTIPAMVPPPVAIVAAASMITVLLRTTAVVGRVAGTIFFLMLAGHASWRAWAILATVRNAPPQSWVAQASAPVVFALFMGCWLAVCAQHAWRYSRRRRTTR